MTFICIFIVWMFSLCLHEFAHAYTAFRGGDVSVKHKGYLSLNPLRYTHPVYSIILPLVFLAIGGIALPGGAVYIERDRLRSKRWETAVSLAGPFANISLAVLLSVPFWLGIPAKVGSIRFWAGYSFFVYLQVMAATLNLLPVPPLDGFGAIEPWLSWRTRLKLQWLKNYGIIILFVLLFWVGPVSRLFFSFTNAITSGLLRVPPDLIILGFRNFRPF